MADIKKEQTENILTNEESLEDVGGFIMKNANERLDGYDESIGQEETTEETSEPSTNDDEVDLSLFDELDKTEEPKAEETSEEEQTPPGFEKFSEDFKKYMGFDVKEAMTMVQELQNLRTELVVREQENSIKSSWGVDDATYQQRMKEVRDYATNIQKKNPEMFKKLDNVEGVKLIWAKLESEQRKASKAQVPSIQTSGNKTPAGSKSSFDFTYSQVQKMGREEYAKNAGRIQRAFAEGRVDMKR